MDVFKTVPDHVDVGVVLEVAENLQDRRVVQSGVDLYLQENTVSQWTSHRQLVRIPEKYSSHTQNTVLLL